MHSFIGQIKACYTPPPTGEDWIFSWEEFRPRVVRARQAGSDARQECGALVEASTLGEPVAWKAVGFNVHLMDIKTRDSYDSAGWRGSDAGQVVRPGGFYAGQVVCRALSFAEHTSLQSTLLCRALSFAEHSPLQSTLLCRARFFAEHSPLQSTLLCRARFFAEHASLQSTLLCRALSFAEHASLQSTLLCRARFFAEHSPLQSTLLCGDGDESALELCVMMSSSFGGASQLAGVCEEEIQRSDH